MQAKEIEVIKRCNRCLLPESLPSVNLDRNGICEHCKNYDSIIAEWEKNKSQKKKELEEIVNRVKQTNQRYDCIISLSGGKDSTYALYLFAKVFNLKCLCVTFDNGFLSEYAKKNIKNAINETNADHILYTVNRKVLLKLYKLALQESSQFCSICMRGIEDCIEQFRNDIPLIVTGNGKRTDYLTFIPELFQSGDNHYFNKMTKQNPLEKEARAMVGILEPIWYVRSRKLYHNAKKFLRNPKQIFMKKPTTSGTINIDIYDYVEISNERIIEIIKQEMGWTAPTEFEHMDCLLHEMQHYVNKLKFNELSLHTFYRSYLIRKGEINREEALQLESEELKNSRQPAILNSFLEEIEMTKDEFFSSVKDWKKIDKFRSRDEKDA